MSNYGHMIKITACFIVVWLFQSGATHSHGKTSHTLI